MVSVLEAPKLNSDASQLDKAQRRDALVRLVFSPISPTQLAGLTIDELITYADRMHRTLMGLDSVRQRMPNVFASIEEELNERLGENMITLETPLPELDYTSPLAVLSKIARDEFNRHISDASTREDED